MIGLWLGQEWDAQNEGERRDVRLTLAALQRQSFPTALGALQWEEAGVGAVAVLAGTLTGGNLWELRSGTRSYRLTWDGAECLQGHWEERDGAGRGRLVLFR
jgi:hypothetical protein